MMLRRVRVRELARGRARLVLGQAAGQIAQLVALPFLTRSYLPAEFGLYQVALAAAIVIQPVATLRNEFLIPLEMARERVRQRYVRSLALTAAIVAVALGVYVLVGGDPGAVSLMVAPILAGNAWSIIDNARLIRLGAIRELSRRNLLTGIITAALQIAAAALSAPIVMLGIVVLAARALAILFTRVKVAEWPIGANASDQFGASTRGGFSAVVAGVISNGTVYGLTLLTLAAFTADWIGQVGIAQRIMGLITNEGVAGV